MLRKIILNPQNITLDELLTHLQRLYPTAIIRKPWIGPRMIRVPMGGWMMFLFINRQGRIAVDFNPPWYWILIGIVGTSAIFSFIFTVLLQETIITFAGALPILLGLIVVKGIFRRRNNEVFDRFYNEVEKGAANPHTEDNSIF